MQKLVNFLKQTLEEHEKMMDSTSPEGVVNSQIRRIVIRSLLVIINFIYTKKYLKDVIAGYSQTPAGAPGKVIQSPGKCVLEESGSMKVFRDTLFRVIEASKQLPPEKAGKPEEQPKKKENNKVADQAAQSQGITTS